MNEFEIFSSTTKHGSHLWNISIHDNWLIGLSAQMMHFISIFVALADYCVFCCCRTLLCVAGFPLLFLYAYLIPWNYRLFLCVLFLKNYFRTSLLTYHVGHIMLSSFNCEWENDLWKTYDQHVNLSLRNWKFS